MENLSCLRLRLPLWTSSSVGKESAYNAGNSSLIPGLGRPPEEGIGYPLQYSGLENSMERGALQTTVHGVAESDTTEQLSLSSNKLEMLKSAASDPNMNKSISEDKRVLLKELDLEPTNLSFQLFIAHIQGQLLSLKADHLQSQVAEGKISQAVKPFWMHGNRFWYHQWMIQMKMLSFRKV